MTSERRTDPEDIFLWPDGAWCYRCDLHCMRHRSDDYQILSVDSDEWLEISEG